MCWLRQRYTYPATVVAPLSKGDAAAVTLVSTFSILSKRQMDCYRASPLERGTAEPGGMYRKTDLESPYIIERRTFVSCAGSASVIHTSPLSWHPFEKVTLPLCRLYPYAGAVTFVSIFSILGKMGRWRGAACTFMLARRLNPYKKAGGKYLTGYFPPACGEGQRPGTAG